MKLAELGRYNVMSLYVKDSKSRLKGHHLWSDERILRLFHIMGANGGMNGHVRDLSSVFHGAL